MREVYRTTLKSIIMPTEFEILLGAHAKEENWAQLVPKHKRHIVCFISAPSKPL